jgi:3-oxoacyl-(acyl-carrier-protein) synthase
MRSGGTGMKEINIKLWRHSDEQDWSAEVHGTLHQHISTKTVDELVEYVLVAAQQALLEPEAKRAQSARPGELPADRPPPRSLAKAGTSGIHIITRVS